MTTFIEIPINSVSIIGDYGDSWKVRDNETPKRFRTRYFHRTVNGNFVAIDKEKVLGCNPNTFIYIINQITTEV
uniref:Uncharacterized protein n=1 Tax=viral metagenome TaxID=1070528 RepID=A0A6H1ZHU6_9ZZZZ